MAIAPTPTPRFRVTDLDRWGMLVKSWATRQDYMQTGDNFAEQPPRNYSVKGYPPAPTPTTTTLDIDANGTPKPWALPQMSAVGIPTTSNTMVALPAAVALTALEFQVLLTAAGVILSEPLPTAYTHVIVLQGDEKVMVVRLPPKGTLQASEDDLINGKPYPFQGYYSSYFNNVQPQLPTAQADIMKLHAYRIGDYTLSNCD